MRIIRFIKKFAEYHNKKIYFEHSGNFYCSSILYVFCYRLNLQLNSAHKNHFARVVLLKYCRTPGFCVFYVRLNCIAQKSLLPTQSVITIIIKVLNVYKPNQWIQIVFLSRSHKYVYFFYGLTIAEGRIVFCSSACGKRSIRNKAVFIYRKCITYQSKIQFNCLS